MILVDTRWKGQHGIGRFASEIIPRLQVTWTPLTGRSTPWSPFDSLQRERLLLRDTDLLFSPGYNAGITRADQLLTIHDLMHLKVPGESSVAKRIYYERIVAPAIRRIGRVMTVSNASKADIEEWLDSPHVRVDVVGNGVSPAFIAEGPRDPRSADAFVFVGNQKPHKNFKLISDLLRLYPEYRVVAVVSDPTQTREAALKAGVTNQLQILHGLSDSELAALYRGSLGLIFPSMMEGFGLPALEAYACGRPVYYWKGVPSVAEIVKDGGVAFDDCHDPDCLEAALSQKELGSLTLPHSQEWLDRYRWDSIGLRISNIISDIYEAKHA